MPPPALDIRFARRSDAAVVFELRRANGTRTWQRRTGAAAEFFAVHDLTHLAVESVLDARRGFYGLVAEGWDLADFGHPWPRGPLPPEALTIEVVVGCVDSARAAQEPFTADACNASLTAWYSGRGGVSPLRVTGQQVDAVRALLSDIVWRWHALAPGDSLQLGFPHAAALPPSPDRSLHPASR